jgi:hypothetical protein
MRACGASAASCDVGRGSTAAARPARRRVDGHARPGLSGGVGDPDGCQMAASAALAGVCDKSLEPLTSTNTGGPREDRTRNPRIKSRLWWGMGCLVRGPKAAPTCGDVSDGSHR